MSNNLDETGRYDDYRVPRHLEDGIEAYIEDHRPTGDFLRAVFSNDLMLAVQRADPVSAAGLQNLVFWIAWYAPGGCYGSPENVEAWIKAGPEKSED